MLYAEHPWHRGQRGRIDGTHSHRRTDAVVCGLGRRRRAALEALVPAFSRQDILSRCRRRLFVLALLDACQHRRRYVSRLGGLLDAGAEATAPLESEPQDCLARSFFVTRELLRLDRDTGGRAPRR